MRQVTHGGPVHASRVAGPAEADPCEIAERPVTGGGRGGGGVAGTNCRVGHKQHSLAVALAMTA